MQKHPILITAACLAIMSGMLSSCVKEVTLDAGDRTVVVECVLSNEDVQELSLSFSRGTSEATAMELTDAEATLIDLTESRTVGEFTRGSDGKWRMDYAAVPLHRYRLEVKVPGHELIYAEDTMPDYVPIVQEDRSVYDPITYPFKFEGKFEPDNYIAFNATEFDAIIDPRYIPGVYHLWIYGMKHNPSTGGYDIAPNICCNEGMGKDFIRYDDFNIKDDIYESFSIETEYPYLYGGVQYPTVLSFIPMLTKKGPDTICPIHDRYLKIDILELHHMYLTIWCDIFDMEAIKGRMTEDAKAGHVFSERTSRLMSLYSWMTDLKGVVMDNYLFNEDQEYAPEYADGYLQFVLVSDTYNRYFEEALFQMRRQGMESTDLSELSIYMRENIYTNVKNGAGIFATSTRMKATLMIAPTIMVDFTRPINQP